MSRPRHCKLCDDTGAKDYAGFAMDPCDCRDAPAAAPPSNLDPIVRDIAHKAADDVSGAIHRNLALVQPGQQRAQVALMACASSMAAACAAFLAVNEQLGGARTSDNEAADALWDLMKPMVSRAIGDIRHG
jgi:hypothetical protein